MKYFRIKNWEKYQHRDAIRREGPMLFIRLNVSSLWDEKLHKLTPNQELTWYKLLLYSGQTRNKLPYNSTFLMRVLNLHRKPNLAVYEELSLIETFVAGSLPAELPAVYTPRGEESKAEQTPPPQNASNRFEGRELKNPTTTTEIPKKEYPKNAKHLIAALNAKLGIDR